MKNPVSLFVLLLLASSFVFHPSATTAAPKKDPLTTKGDTLYFNGELVGAKLAKRHLQEGKYILLVGGKRPPLTKCEQSMLDEMQLILLNAFGCTAGGYLMKQVKEYNEVVETYFKKKKGIPDIHGHYHQQFYYCNPVGCG